MNRRRVALPGESGAATPPAASRALDRRILALALPALGALVAEPLFVLADSAIVGRLGTTELAGLALAGAVLVTLVGLFVFLAYTTTAATARRIGAGDEVGALRAGVDGIWLALALGVALGALVWLLAQPAMSALGASRAVEPHAVAYLRASAPGLPGMLVVLAATGALRGRQDTRTPLAVAALGATANVALNVVLVHAAGMGVAGSGVGTAIAQTAMGAVLARAVVTRARVEDVPLRPGVAGVVRSARDGMPLLVRTASLRAAILLTVIVATSLGDTALAAHQVVVALWSLAAFTLDALAIAAQALVGHALGAGDADFAREVTRRSRRWGTTVAATGGLAIAGSGWWLASLFTTDVEVRGAAAGALAVVGLLLPVAAHAYLLDGVLIGAGDGRFLAVAGVASLVVYAPALAAVWAWAPPGAPGLAWLWGAFAGGFMAARAVTNGVRARGRRWLVLGAG